MSTRIRLLAGPLVMAAGGMTTMTTIARATAVPSNLQNGLIGFFDASQAYSDTGETTLQTTTGGTIAALKNQGTDAPGGTDALQATAGNQPTLVAGLKGQNAIHFNGSSDFLGSALSTTTLGSNGGYTLFVVAKANALDGNTSVIRFQTAADGSAYVVFPYTGVPKNTTTGSFIQSGQNNPFNNGLSDGGLSDGNYHEGSAIFRGVSDATDGLQTYEDGVSVETRASNAATVPTGQLLTIGAYNRGQGEFTNADVEAILIYDTALSQQQISDVDSFIASTYLPEPASLGWVGLAGVLLRRRHRKA